jgi:hypothetical protein
MTNAKIDEFITDEQIDTTTTPSSSNAPALKAKEGTIDAACWPEEKSTKEGKVFTAYDVKITRSYKDADGKWQESKPLYVRGKRDLENLSIVVNAMLSQVREHEKKHQVQ